MAEYKVLKEFRDKDTLAVHPVDSVYKTDSEERAEFLQEKGFIGEEVQRKSESKSTKKASKKSAKSED